MSRKVIPEKISLPPEDGGYSANFYEGQHNRYGFPSDYDETVVLAHGLLGAGTMHFAASELSRNGHDVVVVEHKDLSLFGHDIERSRNVHYASKLGARHTSKKGVILIGHSNGVQDVLHAADHALDYQEDEETDPEYVIKAIGSVAGVGQSGRPVSPIQTLRGAARQLKEFRDHPNEEIAISARSAWNLARHPFLATAESLSAATCDVRPQARRVTSAGRLRAYEESYHTDDSLIHPPTDRTDYAERPGTHMAPVVDGDVLKEVVDELYDPHIDPQFLQIAYKGKRMRLKLCWGDGEVDYIG